MSFSKLIPAFTKGCNSRDHAKFIREDSETEIKVSKDDFNVSRHKVGDFIESSPFPGDEDVNFKWKIRFYPTGSAEIYLSHSSIFLHLIWKRVKLPISTVVRFEIRTENNGIVKAREMEHMFERPQSWGYGSFCELNKLQSLSDEENVIVCVQVCAYYETFSSYTSNSISEKKLLSNYANLLESGEFSDIKICTHGTEFKVHRAILSSRSEVFAAMLSHEMTENLSGEITVNDISVSAMKCMLKFIYSCEVDFKDIKSNLELLTAADKYQLEDLKCQCAEYLSSIITEHNAAYMLLRADIYNLSNLKSDVLKYICKNKDKFSDVNFYHILSERNPDLLIDVTKYLAKYVDVNKVEP